MGTQLKGTRIIQPITCPYYDLCPANFSTRLRSALRHRLSLVIWCAKSEPSCFEKDYRCLLYKVLLWPRLSQAPLGSGIFHRMMCVAVLILHLCDGLDIIKCLFQFGGGVATTEDIVSKATDMVKRHRQLLDQAEVLKADISKLEAATGLSVSSRSRNQDLCHFCQFCLKY